MTKRDGIYPIIYAKVPPSLFRSHPCQTLMLTFLDHRPHHFPSHALSRYRLGALNQHLDCTCLRTGRTRLKRRNSILQIESMGHQPFHIEDPALHQADGTGPGVGVTVLELKVDLLRTEPHEGDLHIGFADADNKDFTSKFDGVDLTQVKELVSQMLGPGA